MNKLLTLVATIAFVSTALSGCFGGGNGDDGGDGDDATLYDSAIADNGFRVTGSVTGDGMALVGGSSGSAASASVVELAPDDSGGALDKADFLLDAKEEGGRRVQAELRSMVTAADVGVMGEYFGGVLMGQEINSAGGNASFGFAGWPPVPAFFAISGLARVRIDNDTLPDLQFVQVFATRGMRGSDAELLTEADTGDRELHVVFPGSLVAGNPPVGNETDGFLYYYFENVKLELLTPEKKAEVGSKLSPPARPNVPPIASAMVVLENGTAANNSLLDAAKRFLNVTLDASNSTDGDGTIEAYSWDVQEFNSTGVMVPVNKTTGVKANFSFTNAGLKNITLRIIDDDGAISELTIQFYVNYYNKFTQMFTGANSVGGGTSCQDPVNCVKHSVTIYWGAKRLDLTAGTRSGTPGCSTSGAIELRDPAGVLAKSSNAPTAAFFFDDVAKLAKVGKWTVTIWWQSQGGCSYTKEVTVKYGP